MSALLEIVDLHVAYGKVEAVHGVSLTVDEGSIVTVIGPNGAGKTTLFKAVSGTVEPIAGRIAFEGRDLLAVPPPERAHPSIAHVPEGRPLFAATTLLDNLQPRVSTPSARDRTLGKTRDEVYQRFRGLPSAAPTRGHAVGRRSARCWHSAAH
jgi:branched-chain amino acid transport system ATP-binding protein